MGHQLSWVGLTILQSHDREYYSAGAPPRYQVGKSDCLTRDESFSYFGEFPPSELIQTSEGAGGAF